MFKKKEDHIRVFHLHPIILMIMFDMKYYCDINNMNFNVTSTMSTIEEDIELSRKSSTHRTGRAFDLSLRDWGETEIKDFKNYFNQKYKYVAATNLRGEANLVLRHNSGHGDHIHVQIHSRYKKEELSNDTIAKL